MNEARLYTKAKKSTSKLKGFYVHVVVFFLVNTGLFVLNIVASPKEFWFYWVAFVWGIIILVHAVIALGFANVFSQVRNRDEEL